MKEEKTNVEQKSEIKVSRKDAKKKRYAEYLSKPGVHKFWSTFGMELTFIFVIEMLFKILLGTFNLDWTVFRILISSTLLSLIITTITTNMHTLLRKIIITIFNLIVVVYAWLQMGFVDFLGTFISLGNAEQGTKITDYIFDFLAAINWKLYLIFIPFILVVIYYKFERALVKDGFDKKINFKNWITDVIILGSLVLGFLLFNITVNANFMQNKYQTVSNKELLKYPSNPSVAIKNFGTSVYLLLDIKGTITGGVEEEYKTSLEKKEVRIKNVNAREIDDTLWNRVIEKETDASLNKLNNYFINRKVVDKNDHTGKFKDKNLIVVMLESVAFTVFDEAYKDYFPTLYKLQSEGISAVNNYSPKNNCATGESEMTSEISLYSIETTCTVNTYKNNFYPEALMSMMKSNGYYTSAYHDYTDQYYYRHTIEPNFGSTKYYGVTDLGMSYNPLYKEWPSDVTFVEKALSKFADEDRFASYMVSVTSHAPYMYSSEWGDEYLSLFKDLNLDRTTKRYLSKIKVVDLALEKMLNTLEEKGKLDDTVIVLFGDHYPYALSDKQFASIAKYDVEENQEIDKTPFIIYNSATSPETITKYTSPLDYTPTILNLFGIDYDPRYYLGNDIFSNYDDFVLFPDNSWQNSYGFYSVAKGEFIPKDETTPLSDEKIIEINTEVTNLRNMSALAIKKNYFNYLFKALEKERKLEEEARLAAEREAQEQNEEAKEETEQTKE